MQRPTLALVLLAVLAFFGSVQAFVPRTPAISRIGRTQSQARTVTKMSLLDAVPAETLTAAQDVATNVLIASKATDFGGFTGPAAALLTLGAVIIFLAPPLSTKE